MMPYYYVQFVNPATGYATGRIGPFTKVSVVHQDLCVYGHPDPYGRSEIPDGCIIGSVDDHDAMWDLNPGCMDVLVSHGWVEKESTDRRYIGFDIFNSSSG